MKWCDVNKGFGFIQPENGGPDTFAHISAIKRARLTILNDGQKVSYELQADRLTGKQSADQIGAL